MLITSSIHHDQFGLPITNVSESGAKAYDRYVNEYLSYGAQLRDLFAAADENPGSALLNANAAALHLSFEASIGWEAAAPYLAKMRAGMKDATEREHLFCQSIEAWARFDFAGALKSLDELSVRWPADLCAIKWGQYHAFNRGDQAALLRFGERARVAHEERPYAHGMIAFALEQNHRLDEAEDEGMRAAEIAIDDAWAHHAVAHVMETHGRASDGVRWLDHCSHTWEHKGVFIRDHNWWHAALFRLSLGQTTEALSIYDRRLWGVWPEFPQEQIGAISMLWRLQLRGVDVGDRWVSVVEQVRDRTSDHLLPFHDLHYLCALAMAGEPGEAEDYAAKIADHAAQLPKGNRSVWTEVAAPAANAMVMFSRNDRQKAGEELASIIPVLHRVGGSHAQRHMFQETVDACRAPAKSASGREL